jgi:hypothetical protein
VSIEADAYNPRFIAAELGLPEHIRSGVTAARLLVLIVELSPLTAG